MILNFSGFQIVFLTVLQKIKRNCISGLFCIVNLLELVRKNLFFQFNGFKPLQTKFKQNISVINVKQKCFYKKDIETHKKLKSEKEKKQQLRFLQKMIIYNDFSKKCYLVCVPIFNPINSSSLFRKSMVRVVSLSIPVSNYNVNIRLWE